MRVLLKEGAAEATAASIVVLPFGPEAAPETLSYEDVGRYGVVADVEKLIVMRVVEFAVNNSRFVIPDAEERREEIRQTARCLLSYEVGSCLGVQAVGYGWQLDDSDAVAVDRVPGLLEGDDVVLGPSAPEEMVNARARVTSIEEERVGVEIEPDDLDRIERSKVDTVGATLFVRRSWLEPVTPRRGALRGPMAGLPARCSNLVDGPSWL